MHKRSSKDVDQIAAQIVQEVVDAIYPSGAVMGKNPAAVALGRMGGRKGGPARAARLSKAQRTEIARKAAAARWGARAGA